VVKTVDPPRVQPDNSVLLCETSLVSAVLARNLPMN